MNIRQIRDAILALPAEYDALTPCVLSMVDREGYCASFEISTIKRQEEFDNTAEFRGVIITTKLVDDINYTFPK